jgi:nitrogen regulatory protein PII
MEDLLMGWQPSQGKQSTHKQRRKHTFYNQNCFPKIMVEIQVTDDNMTHAHCVLGK